MPYNDKAVERLIENYCATECPNEIGFDDNFSTCSCGFYKQECIDCWKQALQQEPDE